MALVLHDDMVAAMMRSVFALTTINHMNPFEAMKDYRARTVGLFHTAEAAIEVARHNYGDLYEAGYYPLAVIERVEVGCIYPGIGIKERVWMRWDDEAQGYVVFDGAAEAPPHICNYSTIG